MDPIRMVWCGKRWGTNLGSTLHHFGMRKRIGAAGFVTSLSIFRCFGYGAAALALAVWDDLDY